MAAGLLSVIPLDHVTNGQELIAAAAGYRPDIIGFMLTSDGTGRVKLASSSTVLTALECVAGSGQSWQADPNESHPIKGVAGANLNLVTSGAFNVSGHIIVVMTKVT